MAEPHSGNDFPRSRQIWIDQAGNDHELPPMAFKVAHHLSHYFNRDQFLETGCLNAWPSYEVLAGKCGCGVSTVKRSVNELRKQGHIRTTGGRGRSQSLQYQAVIKPRVVHSADKSAENTPNKTGQNWTVNEKNRSNLYQKTGQICTKRGQK
ncbi:helix-turn-helix domain-containing protein [Ochrobactrum daejeonense]|nr:helix-turn-helix domain-containing protein [Brucella daejeonensis]